MALRKAARIFCAGLRGTVLPSSTGVEVGDDAGHALVQLALRLGF